MKQTKHFLEAKYMQKSTRVDTESCAQLGQLRSLNRGSLPGCLWPVILLVAVFDLTQGPSWQACASLSQDGLQLEGFWEADWCLGPLPQTEGLPCACVGQEIPFTRRMGKMWMLCLLSNQSPMLLLIFISKCQKTGCSCLAWGPSISYLQRYSMLYTIYREVQYIQRYYTIEVYYIQRHTTVWYSILDVTKEHGTREPA